MIKKKTTTKHDYAAFEIHNLLSGLLYALDSNASAAVAEYFLDAAKFVYQSGGQTECSESLNVAGDVIRCAGGPGKIHLACCPIIHSNADLTLARGSWAVFTLTVDPVARTVTPMSSRVDAELKREAGKWQFSYLEWREFSSLMSWNAGETLRYQPLTYPEKAIRVGESSSGDGCAEINNLIARCIHSKWEDLDAHVADCVRVVLHGNEITSKAMLREYLSVRKEKEAQNGGYLGQELSFSPAVQIDAEGTSAEGVWMILRFEVHGNGFEEKSVPYPVHTCVEQISARVVKENSAWIISELECSPVLSFSAWTFDPEQTNGVVDVNGDHWVYPRVPHTALIQGSDYTAIYNLICQMEYSVCNGNSVDFPRGNVAMNSGETKIKIAKRPIQYGLEGFLHEFGFLTDLRKKQKKVQSMHAETTPLIEIAPDGKTARGLTFDLGWSVLAGGMGNAEPPYPVLSVFAREEFELVQEEGNWKMTEYSWIPTYQFPWKFDPNTCRGGEEEGLKSDWGGAPSLFTEPETPF